MSEQHGRKVANADEARKIMKVGVWYDSVEETLLQRRPAAESRRRSEGFPHDPDGRQASAGDRSDHVNERAVAALRDSRSRAAAARAIDVRVNRDVWTSGVPQLRATGRQ